MAPRRNFQKTRFLPVSWPSSVFLVPRLSAGKSGVSPSRIRLRIRRIWC